jgi:hypothetical protein
MHAKIARSAMPSPGARPSDNVARIAVRDHIARLAGVHPSAVVVAADAGAAWLRHRPEDPWRLRIEQAAGRGTVQASTGRTAPGPDLVIER